MLKIRTTKKLQTSLHSDETNKIEFRFKYFRQDENLTNKSIEIWVDAYKIIEIDGNEEFNLIQGGGSYRILRQTDLDVLIPLAKQMTPNIDDPLIYFDTLVANGIKLVIVNEGLWKNQLTINDFE